MTSQTDVQWRTKGTLLQACNCDYGCLCNFNAPPTDGTCDGAWAGQIEEGNFGDADLSGLRFALGAHWPQAIHHGNGEGFIIIDERANDAQRDGLTKILTGQVGGPFAILEGTISKSHGPEFLPIDIKLDGAHNSVDAGSALQLEMEPIRNPVSGAEAYPGIVLPQGLLYSTSTRTSCKVYKVDLGVKFEYDGKDAAFSSFEWKSA